MLLIIRDLYDPNTSLGLDFLFLGVGTFAISPNILWNQIRTRYNSGTNFSMTSGILPITKNTIGSSKKHFGILRWENSATSSPSGT